jgi:hypothetical protein
VRGCRYTKITDSRYNYNRYRYHKNAIINKDISPLVGNRLFVSSAVFFLIVRTMWSLYSPLDFHTIGSNWNYDHRSMIATYLCVSVYFALNILGGYIRTTRVSEVAMYTRRLTCSCMISFKSHNQTITSILTSRYLWLLGYHSEPRPRRPWHICLHLLRGTHCAPYTCKSMQCVRSWVSYPMS